MDVTKCGCGDPTPVCLTRWVGGPPDRPVHYCDWGELHEGAPLVNPVGDNPPRLCTCGSGQPWAECRENSPYCG